MRTRLRFIVLSAVVLAGADLLVARAAEHHYPGLEHHRSHAWVALSLSVFLVTTVLAHIPSRLLMVGCALHAGGTLGNLSWALAHGGYVSNSFVLRGAEGGVAFTLADVFVLAGIVVIVLASMRMTIRHRALLPQSTVAVRLFRRLAAARR